MAGPSQPQVTDEVWDDDRVKSFLTMEAYEGNADFHLLMRAYRGMRPADFGRFLPFFIDAKHDLDATDDAPVRWLRPLDNEHEKNAYQRHAA